LDRSRRNTNPEQDGASVRQAARAARRATKGLPAKQVTNPGGRRAARTDGVALRAYRHDHLCGSYRRTRTDHAADARATSQAKHARAHQVAARIVATHDNTITVEDCSISTWARRWGRRIQLFSPGMLVDALAAECAATGGRLYRAGTQATAMSQHCPCAASVSRKPWPSAPMTARTAVCAPTATSRRRRWRRASSSPIRITRAPRGSTTDLPTPYGRGWPPRTSGRAQSTGTSHQHHLILDRPGPAATAR